MEQTFLPTSSASNYATVGAWGGTRLHLLHQSASTQGYHTYLHQRRYSIRSLSFHFVESKDIGHRYTQRIIQRIWETRHQDFSVHPLRGQIFYLSITAQQVAGAKKNWKVQYLERRNYFPEQTYVLPRKMWRKPGQVIITSSGHFWGSSEPKPPSPLG